MQTVGKKSEALYKDKGSKFYSYALPLQKKTEVKEILEEIKQIHPKANHYCYAFKLEIEDEAYSLSNDDGEPNNSAGAPILGQLNSYNLTNTILVVVRYFGGTKLGISGLNSAYKNAALLALEANEIIKFEIEKSFSFTVEYNLLGKVLAIIDKHNLPMKMENKSKLTLFKITGKSDQIDFYKSLFARYPIDLIDD